VICAVIGVYLCYLAGILKHVEEINFYVLCNDELTYSEYIEKAISSEQCTIRVLGEKYYFTLSSGGETVLLRFETRMMEGKFPSVLTFTYDLLRNLLLSSIAYAVACVDSRIMFITNEMRTSRQDCLYGQRTAYCKWFKPIYYEDFDYLKKIPKRLAGCKYFNSKNSLRHRYMTESYLHSLFCTRKVHQWWRLPGCVCNLCVKAGPASLKSQCINILGPIITAEQRP
jgi:hypothetical protein